MSAMFRLQGVANTYQDRAHTEGGVSAVRHLIKIQELIKVLDAKDLLHELAVLGEIPVTDINTMHAPNHANNWSYLVHMPT